MIQADLERAAAVLFACRIEREPRVKLAADCRPDTTRDGYAIQEELHALLPDRGLGPLAGWKIGCATSVMQAHTDIAEPCAGGVFASQVHGPPLSVRPRNSFVPASNARSPCASGPNWDRREHLTHARTLRAPSPHA